MVPYKTVEWIIIYVVVNLGYIFKGFETLGLQLLYPH